MKREISLVDKENLEIWLRRFDECVDSGFWISDKDCMNLKELLEELKELR